MFFNQDEDDGDFLSPTGGSKLASLFGIDQANSQGGNASLTYTAPKEPKKKKPGEASATPESTGPAVLYAVAAHCYKYVDGQYASQGKLGVAVLGDHAAQDYKILLYVSKQKQVTHAHITSAFTLTLLPNRYATFYDDSRQGWSVMFDADENVIAFAKQVALCKAISAGPTLETLVSQDLSLGEGGPLESNDSAEIRYTGNLIQNNAIGQEFDSNATAEKLFRFKLGKGKVIKGWEEGVLGMKKSSRRLLIVPPSLGYGSSGMGSKVPPGATLIFDIEVVRVKLAKAYTEPAASPATPSPAATPSQTPESAPETAPNPGEKDGETVKARTKSISEQLSQTKTDKAKLISRMAKMGKPMLPLSGAVAADPESDEDTEDAFSATDSQPKPSLPPKPTSSPVTVAAPVVAPQPAPVAQPAQPAQPVAPAQPTVIDHSMYAPQMVQQQMMNQQMAAPQPQQQVNPAVFQGVQMPSQMALYQPQMQQPFHNPYQQAQYGYQQQAMGGLGGQGGQAPTPPRPAAADVHTPVLLSEARQQNTEVRLSLSKLQDKVEKIHEKLDHMHNTQGGQSMALGLPGSLPTMESSMLLHSIQRIVQENERLKKEIFEKNARIESQNDKISDLLQRNQKYVEQSNDMLEQRNDTFKNTSAQSQSRLLQLEQERVHLVSELASERSQVGTLQLEVANVKKREVDLRQQLESMVGNSQSHREELGSLRVDKSELTDKLEQLTSSLKEERLNRKQLEGELSSLQEDLSDLKATNENLEKNLAERKKKAIAEKKRLEEEIEELKSQHEEEISSLKEKLRKQKSSIDATASEQVAEAEEELTKEWKDKCDRLLASAQEKHQRALSDLEEEKQRVEEQLTDMEKKVADAKAAKGSTNKQVEQLQEEVDSLKAWKDKYEQVRTQAATMKERYEDRISDLEEEKEKIIAEAQEAINRLRQGGAGGGGKDAVVGEVKKIMNTVYHELKGEFVADKSYKGSDIHGVILNTVKSTTMKMVRAQEEEESSEEEDEGEDEVDEEEGESEEEEDTKEAIAQIKQTKETNEIQKTTQEPVKGNAQNNKVEEKGPVASKLTKEEMKGVQNQNNSLNQDETPEIKSEQSNLNVEPSKVGEKSTEKGEASAGQTISETLVQNGKAEGIDGCAGGPVEEKMEVAGAASTVSAPPTTGGKKADKPRGGFSLGGLESSIITGDTIPTSDKNKAKSPDAKKQKKDSETVPVVAMVTGDKGNPYYAAELKKAAEEAKKEKGKLDLKAEKPAAGKDKGQKSPVEPVAAPITGDKGNPYYAEELRKAAEKAKATVSPVKEEVQAPVMAMTTSAPPPAKGAKDKVEKPVSVQTTSAPTPGKPKEKEVSAGVCGDKGNPYYAEELRKAAEEAKKTVEKGGKDLSAHVASVTGDKGNPYYAAELMGKTLEHKTPEQPKRSEAEVLAGIEASMLAVTGIMAGAKKDDPQTKKEKDSDNKNQKEKKEDKKDDKGKAKADGDKKKSTEKSLFDDDDDEDLFAAAKPAKKDATPAGDKKTDKKTDAKKAAPAKDAKKGSDSEDDLRKPPPPPLFGEEEDDDDWLS